MRRRCAFLSLDDPGDYVIDDDLAVAPLAALGWRVSTVSWRQAEKPWRDFDMVLIRSTWDYHHDVPGFLRALAEIDRRTRLANPLDLVRWNLRKTYLRDLEDRGVAIVPTLWPNGFDTADLGTYAAQLESEQLVVKPQVGASGEGAFQLSMNDSREDLAPVSGCLAGRACMVQPFRDQVLQEGEFSVFYFGGEYSHAILKRPAAGEFRSQEERGGRISAADPEPLLSRRAREVLGQVSPLPLYARVDLVRNGVGDFELMELELIEPSLYLRTDPDAPSRLARAVDDWANDRC